MDAIEPDPAGGLGPAELVVDSHHQSGAGVVGRTAGEQPQDDLLDRCYVESALRQCPASHVGGQLGARYLGQ